MDQATKRLWVWELPGWPGFTWDDVALQGYVSRFVNEAAWQSGALAFVVVADVLEVHLEWLADEALETSAIEGEYLQRDSIRASLLHFFGLEAALHAPAAERGVAKLAMDVYQTFEDPLSHEMLCDWHLSLMSSDPAIRAPGRYRSGPQSAQIVTVRRGSMQSAVVDYEAPPGTRVAAEMDAFVEWFNEATEDGTEADAPRGRRRGAPVLRVRSPVRGRQRSHRPGARGKSPRTLPGAPESDSAGADDSRPPG